MLVCFRDFSADKKTSIDFSSYPSGTYVITMIDNDGMTSNLTIIKQ